MLNHNSFPVEIELRKISFREKYNHKNKLNSILLTQIKF